MSVGQGFIDSSTSTQASSALHGHDDAVTALTSPTAPDSTALDSLAPASQSRKSKCEDHYSDAAIPAGLIASASTALDSQDRISTGGDHDRDVPPCGSPSKKARNSNHENTASVQMCGQDENVQPQTSVSKRKEVNTHTYMLYIYVCRYLHLLYL